MSIKLTNVRLAFADIFTAKSFANDPKNKPAYSCQLLVTPGSPDAIKIEAAMKAAAIELWGAKGADLLKTMQAKDDGVCFRDGSLKDYSGYDGMMYLAARSPSRPKIFDRNPKKPDGSENLLTEEDGRPYAGCFVDAIVDIYATNTGGKKVCCGLKGLQFRADGDAFSGSAPAKAEDFDSLDTEPSLV